MAFQKTIMVEEEYHGRNLSTRFSHIYSPNDKATASIITVFHVWWTPYRIEKRNEPNNNNIIDHFIEALHGLRWLREEESCKSDMFHNGAIQFDSLCKLWLQSSTAGWKNRNHIVGLVNGRLLTYDDYFWTIAGPKSKATGNVGLVRVFPWPLM